jgi:hypothetical protein
MRPGDFKISEAEAKLETKLRDYHRKSSDFQPRSLPFQAEYNCTLWSHVDVPIKRGSRWR